MFCSEVNFTYMTDEGIAYLNDWASMCFQFQDLNAPDFFNELKAELKANPSSFFQNCFRESLEVNFTIEQKEFMVQGLLNSPEHLMQMYFVFLLHDYLFANDNSQCAMEINMKIHQLSNLGAPYHLIPNNIAIPESSFLSIGRFKKYLMEVCNHWMEHGDFTLKISQSSSH